MLPTRLSPAAARRTLPVLATLATFVVLSGSWAALLPGAIHPSSGARSSVDLGGQTLAEASASLTHGAGPAGAHPATLPASPGGYGWANISNGTSLTPSGRLGAMTWDASDGYVLLYGWDTIGGFLRDTWSFANGTWTNLTAQVGTPPPATSYPAIAYDPAGQKVVLYSAVNNTTWTYHGKVWTNITGSAGTHPPQLSLAGFTTDTSDNEAVLFGGQYMHTGLMSHETWVLKNGAWTNITATAAFSFGRIIYPVGADDPTDHGIVAYGLALWKNTSPELIKTATFIFASGTWTNLTPTLSVGPLLFEEPGFAWLGSIAADVLTSNLQINSTGYPTLHGGTWEFSHGAWRDVTVAAGQGVDTSIFVGLASDPVDQSLVAFGGERLGIAPVVYPNTFLFSASPTVTVGASHAAVDAGQSVAFTGSAIGGPAPLSYHWNFGDGASASTLSGTHSYTQAGLMVATLTVTDSLGRSASASVSVFVSAGMALTANATPLAPLAGSWVALNSHLTGGTAPFTYSWTLGDNATASTPSLGHVYAKKGSYSVNVTVTDATGATTSAAFVLVVAAAPTPSTSSSSVSVSSGTGLALLLVIVILIAILIVMGAMLARRPKAPPPAPTPYMPSPPPGTPQPPPGAGGPPSS